MQQTKNKETVSTDKQGTYTFRIAKWTIKVAQEMAAAEGTHLACWLRGFVYEKVKVKGEDKA